MRVAIQRELPQDVETVVCGYRNHVPDDVDAVILGGGTLIGCSLPTLHTFMTNHDVPLMIMGCGFREYNSKKEWGMYWEHASHIAVRGEYTLRKLKENHLDIGKVNCIGDPIFLYQDEGYEKEPYTGVVHRPHNTGYVEKHLNGLSELVEHPVRKIGLSKNQKDVCDKYYSLEDTYKLVCKSSFWFGNRLHPFALALINRIPAIAVDIEYHKVYDLCTSVDYMNWVSPDETPVEAYHEIMGNWGEIMDKVQPNISEIRANLKTLIGDFITYVAKA